MSEVALVGTTWQPVRDYIWLDGRPLAQIEYATSGRAYFYHLDEIGLPRALTNESAQTVWSASRRPYGDVVETTGTDPLSGRVVVTNLRLPGQYDERLLGSVGLQGPYYNWNRWYLPGVGRYLELDPIAMMGGFNSPYGIDWYSYGSGNPLRYSDPTGLTPALAPIIIGIGGDALVDFLGLAGLCYALGLCHSWSPQPQPPPPPNQCQGPPPMPVPILGPMPEPLPWEMGKGKCYCMCGGRGWGPAPNGDDEEGRRVKNESDCKRLCESRYSDTHYGNIRGWCK